MRYCHFSYASLPDQPTRPVGVNLIEGKLPDVIDFLGQLTFSAAPGVADEWQTRLAEFRLANERIHEHIDQRSKYKNRTGAIR